MATQLDLQEQEQLDELKAFWNQHGNLITAVLVIVVGAYLAWLGWNAWQRDQGAKAGSMYDELDRAAQGGDADRAGRIFADMKERFPRTTFTVQGGLLAAKTAAEKGQLEAARGDLAWVAESGAESEYRSIARLRMAGILLDDKKYDEALKQLDGIESPEFAALVADRRGDVLAGAGRLEQAKAAYRAAWDAMDEKVAYRQAIEAKLNVLGASPRGASAGSVAAAAIASVATTATTATSTAAALPAVTASTAVTASATATAANTSNAANTAQSASAATAGGATSAAGTAR